MSNPAKNKIAIIDYGMGNLFNVERACAHVGLQSVITSDKEVIANAQGVILPGVGAFGDAMNNLKKMDLTGVIQDHVSHKKPFLGICLGMQLLLSESEEFGKHKGLDIIKGRVVRFDNKDKENHRIKVPQVGWNQIYFTEGYAACQKDNPFYGNVPDGEYMYFVHSFYVVPDDAKQVLTRTRYENTEYCSSLYQGSVFATQFHPERSGIDGLKIYKNWALTFNAHEELINK